MKIGIIGPGEVDKYCKRAKINKDKYEKIVSGLAKVVADKGAEIVITPDKASTSELFGLKYKEQGGKKINVIAPLDDKEFGYSWVNTGIGNNTINCGTWRNQPENLCENSDLLICIGWGGGTLCEIYYTRWFGKIKKVYIINDLIDSKLPNSLDETFKIIEYIDSNQLKEKLK